MAFIFCEQLHFLATAFDLWHVMRCALDQAKTRAWDMQDSIFARSKVSRSITAQTPHGHALTSLIDSVSIRALS